MSATTIAGRVTDMSPKAKARWAGGLLLITIIAGGFAQGYIAGSLIVFGDAATTATNILAHQQLYRLAFATYLVEMSCQIAMTVLFYELLKPVSTTASMLAATFGLIGCTIKTLSRLFFFAPLLLLGGAHYLSAFEPAQLQALAFLSLRVNYAAETMAMWFFGLNTVVMGYLLYRSTFLPRWLGALTVVGGLGWMLYLYEPVAARLESYIVGIGVIGAFVTVVWLLVYGLNEQRWYEQSTAASASIRR
ncbi:MAG: DUF4386 domain-containing protein [Gemmatimonadota bacterium]|nr:DUF4386 domain-containing protein [Gemmatimonadota bacterium]